MKVTFDTNVIDRLLLPENQARLRPILKCVDRGSMEFYATQELVYEAVGIIGTPRADQLPLRGQVLGCLVHDRLLRPCEGMMAAELAGDTDPCLPSNDRRLFLGLLARWSDGMVDIDEVRRIEEHGRQERETAETRWRTMQAEAGRAIECLSEAERLNFDEAAAKLTVDEMQERNWEVRGREFIERFCRDYDIEVPEEVAERVMRNPDEYPYVRRYHRVFALLLHRFLVRHRKIRDGDHYDARQVVLVRAVDLFVTCDKRLRTRVREVGGGPEALSVEDFLSRDWS